MRERMLDAGVRRGRTRRAAAGALSGAFKYSRAHRATGPACIHAAARMWRALCTPVCALARAGARKQRVIKGLEARRSASA